MIGKRLALLGLLSFLLAPAGMAQRAVFLVRHAEKADDSTDTALSKVGEARAEALARHLRDAGVTAILVTQYKRTAQTAEPLAAMRKLTPVVIQAKNGDGQLQELREKHREDVVLVVGHSNSIPVLLKKLGVAPDVTIGEMEFDNLFLVVPRGEAPPLFFRLRY